MLLQSSHYIFAHVILLLRPLFSCSSSSEATATISTTVRVSLSLMSFCSYLRFCFTLLSSVSFRNLSSLFVSLQVLKSLFRVDMYSIVHHLMYLHDEHMDNVLPHTHTPGEYLSCFLVAWKPPSAPKRGRGSSKFCFNCTH